MPAANKFNGTVHAFIAGGNLNLNNSDTVKLMLTNTVPVVTNNLYSDISGNELASGLGYTTGGASVTATSSVNTSGSELMSGTVANPTWTATGNMGPFRYVVLYDSTTGQLLAWWDYGSSITLTSGQTFTFSAASGLMTIQ